MRIFHQFLYKNMSLPLQETTSFPYMPMMLPFSLAILIQLILPSNNPLISTNGVQELVSTCRNPRLFGLDRSKIVPSHLVISLQQLQQPILGLHKEKISISINSGRRNF